jgi:hypothetical protein
MSVPQTLAGSGALGGVFVGASYTAPHECVFLSLKLLILGPRQYWHEICFLMEVMLRRNGPSVYGPSTASVMGTRMATEIRFSIKD